MAKKVSVELIDDLDGESIADETIKFSFDGKNLEIDLSAYHAKAFRENLADYIEHARPAGGSETKRSSRSSSGPDSKQVRTWARENGYDVPTRGRVPATILDAYRQAS